jgi:hypothetical protein
MGGISKTDFIVQEKVSEGVGRVYKVTDLSTLLICEVQGRSGFRDRAMTSELFVAPSEAGLAGLRYLTAVRSRYECVDLNPRDLRVVRDQVRTTRG